VLKEAPDHHDADLVLKIYDLRREPVMRESRNTINAEFWPRSAEEAVAVTATEHPLNVAFRQTSGYWELVYGIVRHGIIHPDFLVENNGEGLCSTRGSSPIWRPSGRPRRPGRFETPSGSRRTAAPDRC
jgi:hypothetical protein